MFKYAILFISLGAVAFIAAQDNGVPPFLAGAPPNVVSSFGALIQANANKPDSEIDKAVEAWVATQDASIKTKFADFKKQVHQMNSEAEKAHQAALAKFSPEAKAADQKMSAIAANGALSPQQKGEQIDAIMKSLPPSVKSEIEKAMQG
uniref:DUF148 domain-containing protein n=1 Tax=Parastrongyloides trichosuri TaxID=131310 RepID=A0A0N4ZCP1_PARTI